MQRVPRLPVRPCHRWRAAARLVRRATVGKGIRMSAVGTFRTQSDVRPKSVLRSKADFG